MQQKNSRVEFFQYFFIFLKMGQTLFCYIFVFSQDKYGTNTINDNSLDGVLGTRTQGSRMVGADNSTVLWQYPIHSKI